MPVRSVGVAKGDPKSWFNLDAQELCKSEKDWSGLKNLGSEDAISV